MRVLDDISRATNQSCFSSSKTSRSFFSRGAMPFSLAKRSHLVSGRGFGSGFSRGSTNESAAAC